MSPSQTVAAADPRRLGPSRGTRRQRHRAGRAAELAPAAGRVPAHPGPHRGPLRRPAGRADGQFRSRPHEHRRRPHRLPGPDPRRCRDRGRQFLRQCRTAGGLRRRPRRPAAPCMCSACCRPAACTATRAHIFAMIELAARAAACRASPCMPSSTAATRRRARPKPACARCRQACDARGQRAHRHDQRPLLRDGSRPALGSRRAWPTARSPRRRPSSMPAMRCAALAAAYARGENDEFVKPTVIGGGAPMRRWRRGGVHEFPRRPRAPADCLLRARRTSTASPGRARSALSRFVCLTEYDATLPAPVAFGSGRSAQHAGRSAGRARPDASCASPKPRNTRT